MQTNIKPSNASALTDADLDQVAGGGWRLPIRFNRPVKLTVRPDLTFKIKPMRLVSTVPAQSAPPPRPELEPLPPTFTFDL